MARVHVFLAVADDPEAMLIARALAVLFLAGFKLHRVLLVAQSLRHGRRSYLDIHVISLAQVMKQVLNLYLRLATCIDTSMKLWCKLCHLFESCLLGRVTRARSLVNCLVRSSFTLARIFRVSGGLEASCVRLTLDPHVLTLLGLLSRIVAAHIYRIIIIN